MNEFSKSEAGDTVRDGGKDATAARPNTPIAVKAQPKTGPMTLEERALERTASEILGPKGIASVQGKA